MFIGKSSKKMSFSIMCSYHNDHFRDYGNVVWLIAVTFLSIGYGDIVATTQCGRMVSLIFKPIC